MQHNCNRRSFIKSIAVLGGAVLILPSCKSDASSNGSSANAASNSGNWQSAGPASQFTDQYTLIKLPNNNAAYIRKKNDKEYEALGAKCTHRGCLLNWKADSKTFFCPCHRGQFDETGKNISGPPRIPLPNITTKVDNGNVMLQLS